MTLNLPSSTLVPTNSSDSQLVDDRAVETAETVPEFHDPADALSADEVLDAIDTHTSEPVDPIVELLRPTGILLIGTHYTDADLHRAMQALPGALRGADHTLRELAIRRAAAILKAAGVEQPMQLIRGVAGNGADPSRDGIQGEAIRLAEPAPWDDAVSGADLLQQIQDAIGAYVVLPPGGAAEVTLWVLHAHAIEASAVSPLLAAVSPEKRCGKSTLLVVLAGLVPKPLLASNITPAVLFRTVEKYGPTLLVDEVDSFLGEREELRGLLNSGHHRAGAFVLRAVGDDFEPRAFSTWCPKAVALIGRPPATVEDRAVVLPMRRRRPDEALRRLRLDRLDGLTMLQRQAWRWAQDHLDQLRDADPDIPTGLDDRAADNWRPLLAVADLAGGPWPERAREAAQQLSGAGSCSGFFHPEDGWTCRARRRRWSRKIFCGCGRRRLRAGMSGPAVLPFPIQDETLRREARPGRHARRVRSSLPASERARATGHAVFPWR